MVYGDGGGWHLGVEGVEGVVGAGRESLSGGNSCDGSSPRPYLKRGMRMRRKSKSRK
jgi:hypothetical protein